MQRDKIIAIDFDGTIKKSTELNEYTELNENTYEAIKFLKEKMGFKIILWTVRSGEHLDKAKDYLKKHNIDKFIDKYNENIETFSDSPKVYADFYVDDRNVGGFAGWDKVVSTIVTDSMSKSTKAKLLNTGIYLKTGKIPLIDSMAKTDIEKEVGYMISTSHEYKQPNLDAAFGLMRNYDWEKKKIKISDMQGIDKPVIASKVDNMVENFNKNKIKPFIVVDKFYNIKPQSRGKVILLDGHHRKLACIAKGIDEVDVYFGKYNGNAEDDAKNNLLDLSRRKSMEIILKSLKAIGVVSNGK